MAASLLKAAALKAKYLTTPAYVKAIHDQRTAVVAGATSGIGQACAHRLAEQGYKVIAIGRHQPGRAEAVIKELSEMSRKQSASISVGNDNIPKHEFYPCDAFSLYEIHQTANQIKASHPSIDVLVLTQGMATTQGFTPTQEGNDEKMTLHYYSRIALTHALLPALRLSPMTVKKNEEVSSCKGPVVLTVLSGGVHSPYSRYKDDVKLKDHYSVKNAADAAGFYTDLGFDHLALQPENAAINFVHASPGFVNTNWGTEFNFVLRGLVRMMQPLGKKASDCAEYMLGPTVFASDMGEDLPKRLGGREAGIYIMGEHGVAKELTKEHTPEARDFVWDHTVDVLKKAGSFDK